MLDYLRRQGRYAYMSMYACIIFKESYHEQCSKKRSMLCGVKTHRNRENRPIHADGPIMCPYADFAVCAPMRIMRPQNPHRGA